MKLVLVSIAAVVLLFPTTAEAYVTNTSTRRAFLASAAATGVVVTTTTATTPPAFSLDMDAFANRELATDNDKPQLSEDAALCRFGYPSQKTGDACVRAGLPTTRRVGGVDAFGKADRGDFVRCKQFYEVDGKGNYVKKTTCDGAR